MTSAQNEIVAVSLEPFLREGGNMRSYIVIDVTTKEVVVQAQIANPSRRDHVFTVFAIN